MEFNYVLEYTLIHDTVHIYSLSYSCTPYQLIVRCKTLLSTVETVSLMAPIPRKAVGSMYIRRDIPEHVKYPRTPVKKSKVLILCVTGQIPELLRIAVKLHRHHYRRMSVGV